MVQRTNQASSKIPLINRIKKDIIEYRQDLIYRQQIREQDKTKNMTIKVQYYTIKELGLSLVHKSKPKSI